MEKKYRLIKKHGATGDGMTKHDWEIHFGCILPDDMTKTLMFEEVKEPEKKEEKKPYDYKNTPRAKAEWNWLCAFFMPKSEPESKPLTSTMPKAETFETGMAETNFKNSRSKDTAGLATILGISYKEAVDIQNGKEPDWYGKWSKSQSENLELKKKIEELEKEKSELSDKLATVVGLASCITNMFPVVNATPNP